MERAGKKTTETGLSEYFGKAEVYFSGLILMDDLDQEVSSCPSITREFERALDFALRSAFGSGQATVEAHLFLQRVLYRINRLKFFWFDDLSNYKNERSDYLRQVRQRIESVWEPWELSQVNSEPSFEDGDIADQLRGRAAEDLAPSPSKEGIYFRDHMGLAGYRRLLQIVSLDGLVEASQLSRTLAGVSNEVHAMMTRLLVEEYGGGRLSRKHSSFFSQMLEELNISALPEAHFNVVPWEVLATINHSFLLSERKRFYLRYVGGLLYTEISVPAAFNSYRMAAERLGMSEKARGYWDLHIKEDERHGRWMLQDVALPLAKMYAGNATELIVGYDQQRFMSDRAGKTIAKAVRQADVQSHHVVNFEKSLEAAA
ncbi:MAG TPA: iron-containing redox enzyme family protein [Pyrinomonadaceae bacterium]|nr:iron-containing redox enzyme family protein [Pyrinomonadaceae bacterium]